MIEVIIDSVRVSLMSQHRVVILKDASTERYLPIWVGPCEADAITAELQEMLPQRPLTHDLLKNVIGEMGGQVVHILVSDLRNDVYYARVAIDLNGKRLDIDSRPSDAIALAVRARCPIFVAQNVMDKAAIRPDQDVESEKPMGETIEDADDEPQHLSAFQDFLDNLDIDLDEGDDD